MKAFEIIIASPPDREKLVAEIWRSSKMIAEINQENEKLELEIYLEKEESLKLDYKVFLEVLKDACEKLTGNVIS